MIAFKGLLQWIEGTEDKNDFSNNWLLLMWEHLQDLYYGLKVLRMKMT